jgi:serine/threonine-protein kinase HipA
VYDDAWTSRLDTNPLSLSLPYGDLRRGAVVQNYFDNLLPDSESLRNRLAHRLGASSPATFDLLAAAGRDCVGAVQLLGEDESPIGSGQINGQPMTESDVERLLLHIQDPRAPNADADELRISLAGAQEKTALLWYQGQWLRPLGSTPTTHILKLPMGLDGNRRADFTTSVENEWLCMSLVGACGLPVARTAILRFNSQKVLAVQRFDRQFSSTGDRLIRLMQEDFCQALGFPSHLKYQADGGPGLDAMARVLSGSRQSPIDLERLFKAQLLFWILAAPDGHAKNFSIRLLDQGRYQLAPLYDVMSIWPVAGASSADISWHRATLAMALAGNNRHYKFKEIQRRHFESSAVTLLRINHASQLIDETLAQIPRAIEMVEATLPEDFPKKVADSIFRGARWSAARLAAARAP